MKNSRLHEVLRQASLSCYSPIVLKQKIRRRAHTHTHTCLHAHAHAHTRTCTHARTHTRTHAHTRTHTHARTEGGEGGGRVNDLSNCVTCFGAGGAVEERSANTQYAFQQLWSARYIYSSQFQSAIGSLSRVKGILPGA